LPYHSVFGIVVGIKAEQEIEQDKYHWTKYGSADQVVPKEARA